MPLFRILYNMFMHLIKAQKRAGQKLFYIIFCAGNRNPASCRNPFFSLEASLLIRTQQCSGGALNYNRHDRSTRKKIEKKRKNLVAFFWVQRNREIACWADIRRKKEGKE